MARHYHKSIFKPKFPQKYVGKHLPIARSSWENTFMIFLDLSPNILQWASEAIRVPYRDPLTGKQKGYYPDFFMVYLDKDGVKKAEIVEIKPSTQTGQKKTKSAVNNAQIIKNHATWTACLAYCAKNGLKFHLITELEMFRSGTKK